MQISMISWFSYLMSTQCEIGIKEHLLRTPGTKNPSFNVEPALPGQLQESCLSYSLSSACKFIYIDLQTFYACLDLIQVFVDM